MRHSLKKTIITICLSSMAAATCFAVENNYYSDDIDEAIHAAKQNPSDKSYVGARWYNRSTSRSFSFPKMMNTEMDQEVVEGAMGPTAAGEAAAAEAQQPATDAALNRKSKASAIADTNSEGRRNTKVNATNQVDVPYEIHIKSETTDGPMGSSTVRNVRGKPLKTEGRVRPSRFRDQ